MGKRKCQRSWGYRARYAVRRDRKRKVASPFLTAFKAQEEHVLSRKSIGSYLWQMAQPDFVRRREIGDLRRLGAGPKTAAATAHELSLDPALAYRLLRAL